VTSPVRHVTVPSILLSSFGRTARPSYKETRDRTSEDQNRRAATPPRANAAIGNQLHRGLRRPNEEFATAPRLMNKPLPLRDRGLVSPEQVLGGASVRWPPDEAGSPGGQRSNSRHGFCRHLPSLSAGEIKEMEKLNPKSPDDLEEERQEEEFLKGGSPAQSAARVLGCDPGPSSMKSCPCHGGNAGPISHQAAESNDCGDMACTQCQPTPTVTPVAISMCSNTYSGVAVLSVAPVCTSAEVRADQRRALTSLTMNSRGTGGDFQPVPAAYFFGAP
jgi:hypothetical protein